MVSGVGLSIQAGLLIRRSYPGKMEAAQKGLHTHHLKNRGGIVKKHPAVPSLHF